MWQFTKRVLKWLWKVLSAIAAIWWVYVKAEFKIGIAGAMKRIEYDNARIAEQQERNRWIAAAEEEQRRRR